MYIHAEREFKILSKLKGHPNIVEGVEYIPEFLRSRGYLVMEKVQGQHLLNYTMDHGPVDEDIAKVIVKQVIEGVDYMHESGVIHRDLNPTNLFITNEETKQIKILDFNVSKLVENKRLSNTLLDDGEEAKF